MKSDNGNTIGSEFYPEWETSVFKRSSGYPGRLFFHTATLENTALFRLQKVSWTSSRQPGGLSIPNMKLSRMHDRARLPQQTSGRLPPLIPSKLLACIEELTYNNPNLIHQE